MREKPLWFLPAQPLDFQQQLMIVYCRVLFEAPNLSLMLHEVERGGDPLRKSSQELGRASTESRRSQRRDLVELAVARTRQNEQDPLTLQPRLRFAVYRLDRLEKDSVGIGNVVKRGDDVGMCCREPDESVVVGTLYMDCGHDSSVSR